MASTTKHVIINKVDFKATDKKVRAAIAVALDKTARHLEGEAAAIVTNEKHNYTGTLTKEITAERYDEKGEMGVNCFVKSGAAPYAQVIHDQRVHPAKRPPFKAIAAWVNKKLGISKEHESFYPIVQKIRSNIAKNGLKSIGADGLQFFWRPLSQNYKTYMKWVAAFAQKVKQNGKNG